MSTFPERLLLVRHGETDWNQKHLPQGQVDIPLNENGRRQARALAQRLNGWTIHALYSSNLSRAAETAAVLGAALGLTPQLAAAWREIDLGGWCGLDRSELEARFAEEFEALERGEDVPRGGGENMAAVRARVAEHFELLRARHAGETLLVVGHSGSLKALIGHLIGLENWQLRRLSLRGNTGLSVVEFDHHRPQLVLLNDTSHLENHR